MLYLIIFVECKQQPVLDVFDGFWDKIITIQESICEIYLSVECIQIGKNATNAVANAIT